MFFFEVVDLLVSVLFLLAAMVGVIIGTQYTPGFHLFFGPSNTEWTVSVLIMSGPFVENKCVSFFFSNCEEFDVLYSSLLFGQGTRDLHKWTGNQSMIPRDKCDPTYPVFLPSAPVELHTACVSQPGD